MHSKSHWDRVYSTRPNDRVSWFQAHAEQSLRLIVGSGVSATAEIIDVGGGTSTLADDLLAAGYRGLSILDISSNALANAQRRIGEAANLIRWIEGDITTVDLPVHAYDVWHDRAVFHFLVDERDRQAYVAAVLRSVKPGGHVIVATFAEDGPLECSGLPVARYNPTTLHAEFGSPFELLEHRCEAHHTPFGTVQKFVYCYCRKRPS